MSLQLFTRLPLRFMLPALLLIVALVGSAFSLHYNTRYALSQVQRYETDNLARLLTRLQETLEYLVRTDQQARVIEEVAALGADPSVQHALVIDGRNRVLASLRRSDIDAQVSTVLGADSDVLRQAYASAMERARSREGGVVLDAGHSSIVGVFPLLLPGDDRMLHVHRKGLLLMRFDLQRSQHEALQAVHRQVGQFALVMVAFALGLGVLIHFVVSRRMDRLVAMTRRVAGGDLSARVHIKGGDELAHLGQAFDRMTEEVAYSQHLLAEREERLVRAQAIARVGNWDWNIEQGTLVWSPEIYRIFGFDVADPVATYGRFLQAVHPEDRAAVDMAVNQALASGRPYNLDHRILRPDGGLRYVHEQARVYRDAEGRPVRMVGTVQDVTERKRMEHVLFEAKERAQVTLDSIGDAVITTDREGRVEYLNPVAEALTGWPTAEARGRRLQDVFEIINELSQEPAENPVEKCLRENCTVALANHTVLINRDGKRVAIEDSAAPIRDRDGTILGVIMVFHDVSKTRAMAQQLSWQASHDALTGLVNRREFENRLREALGDLGDSSVGHALLYIDLDQFKVVNDTCGHVAGDDLLRKLSAVLKSQIRESDTLARLGGDEFGVLLSACPLEQAESIAHKLLEAVREFRFMWQERSFEIGTSIGLVVVEDERETLQSVLSAADMACYAAKDLGRNRVHVFRQDDLELLQRHDEMQLVSRITSALNENRFVLHRQRIAPLHAVDGVSEHYELLLRMVTEGGVEIPPSGFMPAAERYSLMPAIDRWVVSSFLTNYADELRDLTEQQGCETGRGRCFYAINLSGASLTDDRFLDFIEEQLQAHDVPPDLICFEITETVAVANLTRVAEFMRKLRGMGCSFALDDFGSGVSSFAYLKNLPVQYLKIDGSFVKDMTCDPIDRAMVTAIHQIGQVMGMRTIAEFVEDEETLLALAEIGVDYAQGYGIAVPEPLP